MPREEIPLFVSTFLSGAHFLVPIALLVYLLMGERWTAASAVFYTIMVMLLIMVATRVTPSALKRGVAVGLYLIPMAVAAANLAYSNSCLSVMPRANVFLSKS